MAEMSQIHSFAEKWCDKFRDQKINYLELVDHYLADDCRDLGFEMDCGHAFEEEYGNAAYDYEALNKVIDDVVSVPLLGSAIYSRWRYFNHWAYTGAEILEPENRAWFILAFSRLANLTGDSPFIFEGELKRIRIISNNIGYGPSPAPDEEIEQHVTINANGYVWFSAYNYGTEPGRYIRARAKAFKLPEDKCERVFRAFTAYFSNEYTEVFATDIGDWEMVLTNTEGRAYQFRGSLCADFVSDGVDLSDLVRDSLSMNDLFVFDGNNKPDQIDRIQIDYHRITKIKPGAVPEGATWTHVTWDYSEMLTIDRATDTVEHQQIVGSGCKITRRYEVEGGVESILEGLDAEGLFSRIKGNPADVIETPSESKDYSITIDFKKGPQRTLSGSFDKNGLPEDYAEFIEPVFEFMAFYGFGEIFDPKSYNKVKRRTSELMYCGVRFDEGHKTYHYLSDDDSIAVGDFVVVPAGKDDHHAVVEVVSVEYFSEEKVPFPVEKTKSIIRKCDDTDLTEDDDGEYQVECPLTKTIIIETDCIEICDVVNEMLSPDILETLDPPIRLTDEVKQICRGCKYHIG